jgi:hypothetical protein
MKSLCAAAKVGMRRICAIPYPPPVSIHEDSGMLDVVYVLATTAFFAMMLGYVAACARRGRGDVDSPESL